MSFQIHKQLLTDTHYIGKLAVCHVLLNKNALLPWFILVPEATAHDLLDLPATEREIVMDECAEISVWIKQYFNLSKMNFGAIGNIVPQLHLHVIGRSEKDICWPKPVWGNLESFKDYSTNEIKSIKQQLISRYKLVAENDPGC